MSKSREFSITKGSDALRLIVTEKRTGRQVDTYMQSLTRIAMGSSLSQLHEEMLAQARSRIDLYAELFEFEPIVTVDFSIGTYDS